MEIVYIFHSGYLNYRGQFFINSRLNKADNEALYKLQQELDAYVRYSTSSEDWDWQNYEFLIGRLAYSALFYIMSMYVMTG